MSAAPRHMTILCNDISLTWIDSRIRLNHIGNGSSNGTFDFSSSATNDTRRQRMVQSKGIPNGQGSLSHSQPCGGPDINRKQFLNGGVDFENRYILAGIDSDDDRLVDSATILA